MRNYGLPVTEDIIRQFLPLDLALYSVWMPGDVTTAVIASTRLDPLDTYDEIIELDDVGVACADYLVRAGAPTFRSVRDQDAYITALEDRWRQGLQPAEARDAALRTIRATPASAAVAE